MAGEWSDATVSEIASSSRNALVGGPFGSNLVSRDYVDHGVPVIRGQNMGERWVSGEFVYVTPEKAQSLEANRAHPGDIVFTQRGTLGQVCLVPGEPFDRYLVSQSQMKLTLMATHKFTEFVVENADLIRMEALRYAIFHSLDIATGMPGATRGDQNYRGVVLERNRAAHQCPWQTQLTLVGHE